MAQLDLLNSLEKQAEIDPPKSLAAITHLLFLHASILSTQTGEEAGSQSQI